MSARLRFGTFLPPVHPAGQNPTLALQQDLELLAWLDRCGYDEAWCGEHHSGGWEISGCPEILIAMAAERTRHIKLGTGVTSVAYHNPLWVAERMVLLDHLTRGRVMLGLGPGSLPSDAIMIGLSPLETRGLLEDGLAIILQLLRGESVTFENARWKLRDARLQLLPYSNPLFDIAIPAIASPTGAKLAGRYGLGLLSVGATLAAGFDALALHWKIMEEQARFFGTRVDRSKWRLVGMVHCAETQEQAYRDVEYGIEPFFRYMQEVAAYPQMALSGSNVKEMIDFINESGIGAIGTPEHCARQIERLWAQSEGGFGAYLLIAHNWAPFDATKKSYELIARHVFPRFQGQARAAQASAGAARARRDELMELHSRALDAAGASYQKELAARRGS